tara:strand:- start:88 stop:285 length:198 start_codon:yes stop_codon:yes gene_type:complete
MNKQRIILYATVKLFVDMDEGESVCAAAARIAGEADYHIKHHCDLCEIVDTEFLDVSDEVPSHLQ